MKRIAGMLFFLAGVTIVMGIITAEIFYPAYSISQSMISNLGATRPPHSIIHEPSAAIFDTTMIVTGLLVLAGAYCLHKTHKEKLLTFAIVGMGLGTLGVGVFPAFHANAHPLVALIAFLSGGIAAIVSSRITKPPFAFISLFLGLITLLFLFLGITFPSFIVPILGAGGTERWVAYPAVLWLLGFGGYLMGLHK